MVETEFVQIALILLLAALAGGVAQFSRDAINTGLIKVLAICEKLKTTPRG